MTSTGSSPCLPADTDQATHEMQIAIYRRMGGTQRIAAAFRLTELARRTAMAGICRRHPEYNPRQSQLALAQLLLGPDLARQVWPLEELVEP